MVNGRLATAAMRPVLVNSEDSRGGAARAVYRLHAGLRSIGVDSSMLVQVKHGEESSIVGPRTGIGRLAARLRQALDLLPVYAYPAGRTRRTFYPGWLPDRSSGRIEALAPDLVHLHWIAGGFVNVKSLRTYGVPLIWTLHDMWAFTGGCHYDEGCGRYASGCGACPLLGSRSSTDLSSAGFRRRMTAYRDLPLTIVTPSRWLGELVRSSPLLSRFPASVIPNAIDTECFRPLPKAAARERLRLPKDRKLILFGAAHGRDEPRKGFRHLRLALQTLAGSGMGARLQAVVFGGTQPKDPPDLGVECLYTGTVKDDDSLAALYAAADVFVAPSVQENLSNTVMEALACGTSCVAFDIGGMPDMIEHHRNGYLARPFDAADLAEGMRWILEDDQRRQDLSSRARRKVLEEFAMPVVAHRHLELYRQVLEPMRHQARHQPAGALR
jgi:glycosyltransferase involved in cell wall biosynthesis